MFSVEQLGLLALFANTFLAASILPLPSEPSILLAAALLNPYSVFAVAVVGGVLGALTNYYIGLKGLHSFLAKRSPEKERKAQRIFDRYGSLVLIVAPWIPFVGDPLMIVAGALKMDFRKFLALITISRILKTAALVFLSISLFP